MPLEFAFSSVNLGTSSSTIVLTRNPARVYLIVAGTTAFSQFWLWPEQQFGDLGITALQGQSHVMLHRSMYGELVGGDWYGIANPAVAVRVVDAYLT